MPERLEPIARSHSPRRDIQGLRAIAVLAVLVNHLWGWPRGGFVGVDVFFVVSGFLITGLLLRERERNGRISFANFYRRRARRILPAAVLVIATTVIATYFLYNSSRGNDVAADGLAALLFVSNWRFAAIGTDYWQLTLTSPLQHFWSLAVEEQFYIFWPWIIVLLAVGQLRRQRLLVPTMAFLALASFSYSLWHTQVSPSWAYFSTVDRVWELAVGALLAALATKLSDISAGLRIVLGWAGLVGIVLSFFVISPDVSFPAPWAALPVLSTVLVIAAGIGDDQRWLFPVVNPVATYIGDISYSLYLWHFPPIILLEAFYPDGGAVYSVFALGVAAALSVASFHFVEEPVRTSNWLEPKSARGGRVRPRADRTQTSSFWPAFGIVAIVVITFSVSWVLRVQGASDSAGATEITSVLQRSDRDAPRDGPLTPREQEIAEAVEASDFPEFDPNIEGLDINAWRAEITSKFGCDYVTPENYSTCDAGPVDAKKTAVVMGDSYALAYMPGIASALVPKGWRIQNLTMAQCPTWDVPVIDMGNGGEYEECAQHRDWANGVVAEQKPDVAVLISTYMGSFARLASGAEGSAAAAEAEAGLKREIEAIKGSANKVIVLEPPYPTPPLQECVSNVGEPLDCAAGVQSDFVAAQQAEKRAAGSTGATFVNTLDWFCDRDGICPGFVGSTPMRVDGNHLTVEFSESLAPLLAAALL